MALLQFVSSSAQSLRTLWGQSLHGKESQTPTLCFSSEPNWVLIGLLLLVKNFMQVLGSWLQEKEVANHEDVQ